MARFHEASINTVRLVTVYDSGSVIPIAAFARFAQGGRMKDNGVTGGIMVPLDITTGNFTDYGLNILALFDNFNIA